MASAIPTTASTGSRLTPLDRTLLVVPTVAAFGLGLFPLLAAPLFASITNYPPNDSLIYWLAGAGTLGYAVALAIGLYQNDWVGLRFPVIAALAFNVLTVVACIIEVAQGRAGGHPSLFVVLTLSALFSLLYAWLLYQHRGEPRPEPDSAAWLFAFFIFGTVAALGTGLLGYFAPDSFKPLFGLDAVNPFIYRVLGAATMG